VTVEFVPHFSDICKRCGFFLFCQSCRCLSLAPMQLVTKLFGSYSYYQMWLCRIWSRNAENSSALFYVVKRVTKSHVSKECGSFANWAFCTFLTNFWQIFDKFWQFFDSFWETFDNLTTVCQLFFHFILNSVSYCMTQI
jgi:hypothetical protein